MNKDFDVVAISLASAIVHLLEAMREGGRPLDLVCAEAVLQNPDVKEFLSVTDSVYFPLPRDGAEKRFEVTHV